MKYAILFGKMFGVPTIVMIGNRILGTDLSFWEAQGSYALFLIAWQEFERAS